MHSFTWKSGNGDGREAVVHHNGDFSGEVKIVVPEFVVTTDDVSNGMVSVELPFELIKSIAAEYIRNRRIGVLENAEDDDLVR